MKTDASRRIVVWLVALVSLAAALTAALFAGAAGSAREAPRLIAFARPSGVYVMHTDGSHVRRVRRTVGLETMEVAWSPDGRELAFTAYERATGRHAVWAMSADGRAAARLGRFTRVADPTWSADGASVAFAGVGRGIWIVKADGTELRQLETPIFVSSVDWSPDGKRLALAGDSGYAPDIYVMDADGGNLRNLTPGRAVDGYQPDWSPNGRRIVFTQWRGDDSRAELYVVDADGRSPVRLTRNTVNDSSPTWSANGRRIAFVRDPFGPTGEIYVMNADGKRVQRLTRSRLPELSPAWQPARLR